MTLPRMAFSPEQLRRLAVELTLGGETPEQAAELLQVSERSVWRWLGAFRERGDGGLVTRPGQGRPPKLSDAQARQVLAWVAERGACDFGLPLDRAAGGGADRTALRGADEPPVPQRLAL